MRPLHRVLFVLAALAAFQGVSACASETPDPGLNPQPLPPEEGEPARAPEENQDSKNTGSSSSGGGSSGSSGSTPGAGLNDGDGGTDGGDH